MEKEPSAVTVMRVEVKEEPLDYYEMVDMSGDRPPRHQSHDLSCDISRSQQEAETGNTKPFFENLNLNLKRESHKYESVNTNSPLSTSLSRQEHSSILEDVPNDNVAKKTQRSLAAALSKIKNKTNANHMSAHPMSRYLSQEEHSSTSEVLSPSYCASSDIATRSQQETEMTAGSSMNMNMNDTTHSASDGLVKAPLLEECDQPSNSSADLSCDQPPGSSADMPCDPSADQQTNFQVVDFEVMAGEEDAEPEDGEEFPVSQSGLPPLPAVNIEHQLGFFSGKQDNQLIQHLGFKLSDKESHETTETFKCLPCGTTFPYFMSFTKHDCSSVGEKRFICDICWKEFKSAHSLQRHKLIHTGAKPYVCDVCGKAFTQATNLTTHKRLHTGEKPFKCDSCDKTFSHASGLHSHRQIHSKDKPFVCGVCGKGFTFSSSLYTHKRTHTGERPYECDVCGRTFNHSSNLHSHKLVHSNERPFKCDLCGKAFNRSCHFTTHMRAHANDKPFVCDLCGKSFLFQGALTAHKRVHTGERPFSCEVCGKTFSQSCNLVTHKRTHTGAKLFQCNKCGKDFASFRSLERHKATHIEDQEGPVEQSGPIDQGSTIDPAVTVDQGGNVALPVGGMLYMGTWEDLEAM